MNALTNLPSRLIDTLCDKRLLWLPELGLGWYPVSEQPYDVAYWQRYRAMDLTPIGQRLTAERVAWVRRFWRGDVCDIGIGGGAFVKAFDERWGGASGFDINPHATAWLHAQGYYTDPFIESCGALTFWDSLEHIHEPEALLARARHWVFVSLPIFLGHEHVMRSRHFRRDEHCWYFSFDGLVDFMRRQGFGLVAHSTMEQDCGREDIETFAFCREPA